jgi:hypothetical protein
MAELPYGLSLNTAVYLALTAPKERGHPSPDKPIIELLRSGLPIDNEIRNLLADLLERGARPDAKDDGQIMLKFHNHRGKNSTPAAAARIKKWIEIWLYYKSVKGIKGGAKFASMDKFSVSEDQIKDKVRPVGKAFDKWLAGHHVFGSVWQDNEDWRLPNAIHLFATLYADKKYKSSIVK